MYKELVSDDILWLYVIQITHSKFIDKVHNLLVIMNDLKSKYSVRIILKKLSDIGTHNVLNINQYLIIEICNIISWVTIYFNGIQIINSILQKSIWKGDKYSHDFNIYLRSGWCQHHQCWYILKNIILQNCTKGTLLNIYGSEPYIDPPLIPSERSWHVISWIKRGLNTNV